MGNNKKKKRSKHHHHHCHHEESSGSKHLKRKKSKSSKKKKAKEPYKHDLGDDFEKDEMMDINKILHPISYYITDRAEMVNQMFMSLEWKHIRSMLPPGLKSATEARVKELALREILGISNERILSILNGQQLDSSSDSDVENEDVMISPKIFSAGTFNYDAANESDLAEDRSQSKLSEKNKRVTGASQKLHVQESERSSDDDTLEIGITPKEMGELLEDPPIVTEDKPGENEKKQILEILELEMRARAIRALLKHQDVAEIPEQNKTGQENKDCHDSTGDQEQQNAADLPEKHNETEQEKKDCLDSSVDQDILFGSTTPSPICSPSPTPLKSNLPGPIQQIDVGEKFDSTERVHYNITQIKSPKTQEDRNEASWASRWLKSKEVQKVVTTSRMCGRIRKRMKLKFRASTKSELSKPEITGSVEEYNTLGKGDDDGGGGGGGRGSRNRGGV